MARRRVVRILNNGAYLYSLENRILFRTEACCKRFQNCSQSWRHTVSNYLGWKNIFSLFREHFSGQVPTISILTFLPNRNAFLAKDIVKSVKIRRNTCHSSRVYVINSFKVPVMLLNICSLGDDFSSFLWKSGRCLLFDPPVDFVTVWAIRK